MIYYKHGTAKSRKNNIKEVNMLEYAQLLILTDLVKNYFDGDQLEKDLILLNLELMKKEKILETINKVRKYDTNLN